VYHQAAQAGPLRPEPYLCGLRLAEKLGDLKAKQWATLGLLRQAWPKEQIRVWKTAQHVAQATVEELAQKGQSKEASEFEKARNLAMARDVVVIVTWNGDADVDLLVEEPTGTVCSARNPRSTAGGVMLGDTSSPRAGQGNSEGKREIYVCPEGFGGTYRVLVRRVWGKVTAGKVTVKVIRHFRTDQQEYKRELVPLTDDEAVVVFDLDKGRRTQSLQEHQIANAAVQQLAVRQQILSQQLDSLADPRVVASLMLARQAAAVNSAYAGLRGGVGYQPIIITLPEGANMTCTGVVSADRRYVRVTCVPLFSRITDVRIFNYVSGEESQGSTPNTGGSGYSGY